VWIAGRFTRATIKSYHMAKNLMQDVVPPEGSHRRSIRDIPIEHVAHHRAKAQQVPPPAPATPRESDTVRIKEGPLSQDVNRIREERPTKRNRSASSPKYRVSAKKLVIGILALVVVALVALAASSVFALATIRVTPRQETVALNQGFTANGSSTAAFPYEVMSITRDATTTVPATGQSFVEKKASGQILIYNAYSGSAQKLIATTRFETPDGLIFRISDPVTVPGTTVQGGKTVPGSIEVTVYADQAGEKYNIDLSDFTIPGFKGDPRYEKFYGRSKTKMLGGFSGTTSVAKDSDITLARTRLDEKLKNDILAEVASQKPDSYLLYNDGMFFTSSPAPVNQEASSTTVIVHEQVTLQGVLLARTSLAKQIAEQFVSGYDGAGVDSFDLDKLSFKISNKDGAAVTTGSDVSFSLSGTTTLIWQFDEEKLTNELAGLSKQKATEIFTSYPGIQHAEITVRPFWKSIIPADPKKIRVELD
jgi:hypothetical protein